MQCSYLVTCAQDGFAVCYDEVSFLRHDVASNRALNPFDTTISTRLCYHCPSTGVTLQPSLH